MSVTSLLAVSWVWPTLELCQLCHYLACSHGFLQSPQCFAPSSPQSVEKKAVRLKIDVVILAAPDTFLQTVWQTPYTLPLCTARCQSWSAENATLLKIVLFSLLHLVLLEGRVIANVLANPDIDQPNRDELLSLFVLVQGVDHLHQVPHQLLDVLVPLLADQPRVVVAGKEEERIGAEKVKLSVAGRNNVDPQIVLHVHLVTFKR